MHASRRALLEFEAHEQARQAEKLTDYAIELEPWYYIGPFASPNRDPYGVAFGPEQDPDLAKTYADGTLKWHKQPDWQDGVIHQLPGHGASGEGKIVANYMFRRIHAGRAATLPIYLGSNDGIQVWFNDRRVLARDIGRTAEPDQDIIKLNFKKGVNKLLIKVNNRAAAHAFYFSMHPGGQIKAERYENLWELLSRDFASEKQRQQIRWEQQDRIWDHFNADVPDQMAKAYAAATRQIGDLPKQAAKLAQNVRDCNDVQKVQQIYHTSRLFDEAITLCTQELKLVKNQFSYLQNRFAKKSDDPQWLNYKARLSVFEQITEHALSEARRGIPQSLQRLDVIYAQLTQLHKSKLPHTPAPPKTPACAPFDLNQVRLLDGPFKDAMERDRRYLHDLDSDRLLHMFRLTAGLPSSAEPLGGWENRELRGHTIGHYLSACALIYAATGDEKLKAKADAIVAELAKCQSELGTGYLGAFPEDGIKRVIYGTGNWWAPWYTYHKIMAGMLDMYTHCGSAQALEIAKGMAEWSKKHLDNITADQTQQMLEVEFGGMNEVLANLYAITKNPDHLDLARRFDHKAIFEPLAHFHDELTGLHVNTQIPKIIGAAREFELTGDDYYYNIATFFFDQVVNARSYCTGGTSNHEHWRTEPYVLAKELSPATQETCCTYNMLKLTRRLFCWNPDPRYADYYERALYNSILSTQDPDTGMMMYFVPLASGYWKIFNTPNDSFWCCTGTGLENHAKYGDSIYFHDDDALYVNLFIASQLTWPEKGIRIRQETGFPEEQQTTLTVKTDSPAKFALHIRIPYWAANPVVIRLNAKTQDLPAVPSSFVTLDRLWNDGDRVELDLPMSLHLHPMPDDPDLAAIMFGPLVLAGDLGTEGYDPNTVYSQSQGVLRGITVPPAPTLVADTENLDSWIKPVPGKPLTFTTAGAGRPRDVTLIPYHKLFGRRYAIYWNIQPQSSAK